MTIVGSSDLCLGLPLVISHSVDTGWAIGVILSTLMMQCIYILKEKHTLNCFELTYAYTLLCCIIVNVCFRIYAHG